MRKTRILLLPLSIIALTVACNKKAAIEQPCVENIKNDCFCTKQYDPVCGCNNKTYGNSCEAECKGITSYKKGACKN